MAGNPPSKTFSPKQRAQFIAALAASRATPDDAQPEVIEDASED